jgi:hypothetical protein
MGFLVVGKGSYSKSELIRKLEQWGIENPLAVVKDAARGMVICGSYKIMPFHK